MASPKFSVGLYVPNLDMAWKYNSTGNLGLPDGWTASALAQTDLITPNRVRWVPAVIGGGLTQPHSHYQGSGRAMRIEAPSTLTDNSSRYLLSPRGTHGQLMGQELGSLYGAPAEAASWWCRVRCMFKGTTAPTLPWAVSLMTYNADETISSTPGLLSITAGMWDGAWHALESGPMQMPTTVLLGMTPDHVRLRIDTRVGPSSGTSIGIFDSMTIETLGPIDFAEQMTGEGASLVAADHDTFYQLSKWPQHAGQIVGRRDSLELITRMPSGARYTYDPSGGEQKARFDFPYRWLKASDEQKIARLWLANKGYGGSAGLISYGVRRPLVISGIFPAVERSYYVDFDTRTFPLDVDQEFESPTAAGALWRGNLPFVQV